MILKTKFGQGSMILALFVLVIFAPLNSSKAVDFLDFQAEVGGKGDAPGQFGKELYVTFDQTGQLYVCDSDNRRIQKMTGSVVEIKPTEKDKIVFHHPKDIAVGPDNKIYVVDWHALLIQGTTNPKLYNFLPCVHIFGRNGEYLKTVSLEPLEKPKGLTDATVMIDDKGDYALGLKSRGYDRDLRIDVNSKGELFVLDVSQNSITKFSANGEKVKSFGAFGSGDGQMDNPSDLTIDSKNNIYLVDTGNHRVLIFDSDGNFLRFFGRKGLGSGEFREPFALVFTKGGDVLVADKGEFERKFEEHPFTGKMGRAKRDWLEQAVFLDPTGENVDLYALTDRIENLEENALLGYYPSVGLENLAYRIERLEEQNKEETKEEKPPEKFTKVLRRIQRFSPTGRFQDRVIFKIDKNDEELRDLVLVAIDPYGRVYLKDESRHSLRRYGIRSGLFPRWDDMERIYAARVTSESENFREDFEDVDNLTDEEANRQRTNVRQVLALNYDISEKLNLSFKDLNLLALRDDKIYDRDKPANDYRVKTTDNDNSFSLNLRYVLNPNLYKYREMNIFAKRLDGFTDYNGEAINSNLSLRQTTRNGDASAILVGADYDLTRNSNLSIGFSRLEPDQASRNIDTYLYNTQGALYRVNRHFEKSSVLVGQFTVKF